MSVPNQKRYRVTLVDECNEDVAYGCGPTIENADLVWRQPLMGNLMSESEREAIADQISTMIRNAMRQAPLDAYIATLEHVQTRLDEDIEAARSDWKKQQQ